MKKAGIAIVGSLLMGIVFLAMWFVQREPENKDGYKYRDHLLTAVISSDAGVIKFNDVRVDSFAIWMNGDTLFVETIDTTFVIPGATPPAIPLPFYYTRKIPISTVLVMSLTPNQFHSIYKFPTKMPGISSFEIWAGTEPGGDEAANMTDSADVFITREKELIYGWDSKTDTSLVGVIETSGPRVGAIYDTKRNKFIVIDTIPRAVRDTAEAE